MLVLVSSVHCIYIFFTSSLPTLCSSVPEPLDSQPMVSNQITNQPNFVVCVKQREHMGQTKLYQWPRGRNPTSLVTEWVTKSVGVQRPHQLITDHSGDDSSTQSLTLVLTTKRKSMNEIINIGPIEERKID